MGGLPKGRACRPAPLHPKDFPQLGEGAEDRHAEGIERVGGDSAERDRRSEGAQRSNTLTFRITLQLQTFARGVGGAAIRLDGCADSTVDTIV